MKRVGIWVLVLMILLSGCGNSKKSEFSGNNFELSKKAIEITDEYLNLKINEEEAFSSIKELEKRMNPNTDADNMARIKLDSLLFILEDAVSSRVSDDNEILKKRNELAAAIGVNERK